MFTKIGEAYELNSYNIQSSSSIPNIDPSVLEEMTKYATELKRIAPKANDFLYFSAVMMHAAERSILEKDGSPKLGRDGNPLEAHWDIDANGSWKWVCSDPTVKPFKNCFAPGTMILMEDGTVKPIEDIQVGDMVITHTNQAKRVVKVFKTPHEGKLLEIDIHNGPRLLTTENHPFYKLDVSSNTSKEDPRHLLKSGSSRKELVFVSASKLKPGEMLLAPILAEQPGTELTPDAAHLLGLFAAEGCYGKKYGKYQSARFTFNINETDTLAAWTMDLAKKVLPGCSVSRNSHGTSIVEVGITGHGVVDFFRQHVGEYSEHKSLSRDLVFGSKSVKEAFLIGWLEGDGCVADNGQIIGITVSKNLAYQVRCMLFACGISHSLRFVKSTGKPITINPDYAPTYHSDSYRIEISASSGAELVSQSARFGTIPGSRQNRNDKAFYNGHHIHTINAINEVDYIGDVFNFEVEDDHTYVANGIIVHNCNGDIFPESELIKAYKGWIGKPLCVDHKSSSVEHTRGFIVDTYYDRNLKRIVALCALDKLNYPELARGVQTGYKNSVSMGVGVGNAICFDCGKVAKCEADFCKHMKTKTGYGEINCGLNPLELSLVVNGADGDAKVKDIVAMVDTLNAYVDGQQREIAKIAAKYTANLSYDASKDGDESSQHQGTVALSANDLGALESSIHKALADFAAITQEKTTLDTNNAAYNQSGSVSAMPVTDNSGTDFSLAPPNARFAMTDEQNQQLLQAMSSIDVKLAKIQRDYETLATTKHEDTMSGTKDNVKQGYFQGGGGANEPTPGKPKYEVDPLNIEDRNEHDKQMVGQKPFPDVGSVDQIYPGYDSFPMGELERKKMLARAEAEERAIRRTAVIEKAKQAYFMNGLEQGNANTPAPKKVKYPIDPLNVQDRDKFDKQMVGQKPFPEVGDVEGLHPSPLSVDQKDELKRKELLQRAGLKARLQKAADLGNSTWEILDADERVILSKTFDDLTNGRTAELYAGVATPAFAQDLMSKIRVMGVDKVDALFKKAQVPPMSPAGDAPAVPVLPEDGKDSGKDGDPLPRLLELAEKAGDLGSDLKEAANDVKGNSPEMDMGGAPMAANDSKSSASSGSVATASFEAEIASELSEKMLATSEALLGSQNELKAVARLFQTNAIVASNKDYLTAEIEETVSEAKKAFASGLELMHAYLKFAEAVDEVEKRATLGEETMQPDNKEIMGMLGETDAGLRDLASALNELTVEAKGSDDSLQDSGSADDLATMLADDFAAEDSKSEDSCLADDNEAIMVPDVATAAAVAKEAPDASVEVKKASLEDRVALRAKLASEMSKLNPIFYDFHPQGGETPSASPGQVLKTQDELAHVETIEERHDKMMDVVHAVPAAVKKQAAELNDLIKAGKVSVDQVDQLASFGVDSATIKYWKDFYGEMGSEGKTFAAELVKGHDAKKAEEEMTKYRVKIARAYELAYDHRDAGLISSNREAITACVSELMEMNDSAFDSVKKIVASHASTMKKQASIPQVGAASFFTDEPAVQLQDLRAQLDAAFSNSKPRAF